jgi:Rod binding domain-containing protein
VTLSIPDALPPELTAATPDRPATDREGQVQVAARQFEAMLLTQLVSAMRSTVGSGGMFGGGAGNGMYEHLFDQTFAEAMSQGDGIGVRPMVERQMGLRRYAESQGIRPLDGTDRTRNAFAPVDRGPILPERPPSGEALPGLTALLQQAAREMLPGGNAPQWGLEGRLTEADLASDFATSTAEGPAFFNVRDAAGFEDRFKCNLFALELCRRSGFVVPLAARPRGWGFPGPDAVVADAADDGLRADWGRVVTGESAESLDSAAVRGDRAFLLAASGREGRSGHMGVVERIHEVDYDASGAIRRVVFDGWEGRADGARHLVRRTWNRYGNPGGNDARGGFERIEIIELRRPREGERPERPTHDATRPSVHDTASTRAVGSSSEVGSPPSGTFSSRIEEERPNEDAEESLR